MYEKAPFCCVFILIVNQALRFRYKVKIFSHLQSKFILFFSGLFATEAFYTVAPLGQVQGFFLSASEVSNLFR